LKLTNAQGRVKQTNIGIICLISKLLPIHVFSVPHLDYLYCDDIREDIIDCPVRAFTDAVGVMRANEFLAPDGNGSSASASIATRSLLMVSGGSFFNSFVAERFYSIL
jgi:hypothetical protein